MMFFYSDDKALFEGLRETIYSEVATLISQNERRPHFLIQLFRHLQLLNNDYLRQRALYCVEELVLHQLTDDERSDDQEVNNPNKLSSSCD